MGRKFIRTFFSNIFIFSSSGFYLFSIFDDIPDVEILSKIRTRKDIKQDRGSL